MMIDSTPEACGSTIEQAALGWFENLECSVLHCRDSAKGIE